MLKKKALTKLEKQYENIKVIYNTVLDYSMCDKKLSYIYLENIAKMEAQPAKDRDEYLLGEIKKSLNDVLKNNPEETIVTYHDKRSGYIRFDFYRNLFLLKRKRRFSGGG